MKLLFITNDAGRVHLRYMAQAMTRRGHVVDAVSFVRSSESPGPLPYRTLTCVSAPPRRWRHVLESLLLGEPVFVRRHRSAKMWQAVRCVTVERRYDVVLIEQLAMAQFSTAVSTGTPVLLFGVDCTSRVKAQRYLFEKAPGVRLAAFLDHLLCRRYERSAWACSEAIMLVSDDDIEYAIREGICVPTRLYRLPIGVDTAYFTPAVPGPKGAERTLVFVGNMADFKSEYAALWFFENVWGRLRERQPDLRLKIVGRGPSRALRHLQNRDSCVEVTGYVPDIRPYVWAADLFVSPLQFGTGMKNRVLEGMAMGKAVVATLASIEGIGVSDGEHLVIARDANDFLAAIETLLVDTDRAHQLGLNARAFVERHYRIDRMAEDFEHILDVLLENGAGRS